VPRSPFARAGSIKLLGVTSAQRFAPLPDVPAIGETFAGFNIISYMGLMVPRGTPPDVVAALNREINRVLAEPDMRSWMLTQGMVAAGGTPDDFKRQIDADYQARGEIIRAVGLTGE
jgi:tripartite-type tricarboxylate transporter receptor subunit TctC